MPISIAKRGVADDEAAHARRRLHRHVRHDRSRRRLQVSDVWFFVWLFLFCVFVVLANAVFAKVLIFSLRTLSSITGGEAEVRKCQYLFPTD
jgi:hypothetical protein